MRHFLRIGTLFSFSLILFASSGICRAQIAIDFKRINLLWPTTELYFSASRDSIPLTGMLESQFRILENGAEVRDFTLHPPLPAPCPMSVALVLDASGSMAGSGNQGAIAGALAFLDNMDGLADEAVMFRFHSIPELMQGMTTDIAALKAAARTLPASGATAVWDAIWAGLQEIIAHGSNECRAVVALTDGGDGSSSRTPAEIIALANREHVRVYTIGLGRSINATELEFIGILTGGRYYQTDSAESLAPIYDDIARTIKDEAFGDRMISYESRCPDGTLRRIELLMRDDSGHVASGVRTMRAPRDTTQFASLRLRLRGGTVKGGMPLSVSLESEDTLGADLPLRLRAVFPLRLPGLEFDTARAGALLPDGLPLSIAIRGDSAIVEMPTPLYLEGEGQLIDVTYRTTPIVDTLCGDISLLAVSSGTACLRAEVANGRHCLLPEGSEIVITPVDVPEFLWNAAAGVYEPASAEIRFRVENAGPAEVTGAVFTLSGHSGAFILLDPSTETQGGPGHVLPAQSSEDVVWRIAPLPRRSTERVPVSLLGRFDNANPALGKTGVLVESSLADLQCVMTASAVAVDSTGRRFLPLEVEAAVSNDGGMASDSVTVELETSTGLEITPAASRLQPLVPSLLGPGNSGSARWSVRVSPSATGSVEALLLHVRSGGEVESTCSLQLTVPPLDTMRWIRIDREGDSVLCPGCTVRLIAEEGYSSYRWNTGDTTRAITVGRGSYRVEAIDDEGSRRQSRYVPIGAFKAGYIRLDKTDTDPCIGDTVVLSVRGVLSGALHGTLWSTGDTTKVLRLAHTATVYATALDSNGCRLVSDTVRLEFLPPPEKPRIWRSGDTLYTDAQARYITWWREGMPQPYGGNFLPLRVLGDYIVQASNGSSCVTPSDPFSVTVLTADSPPAPAAPDLQLWPDPAEATLFLRLRGDAGSRLQLTVVDVLGRVQHQQSVTGADLRHGITLPLEHYAPGPYLLLLRGERGSIVRRFRKM